MYSSTNLFPATSSPPKPVRRAAHWFQTSTRPSLSIPKIGAFALRGYHSLHAPPRRRRRAAPLCVSLHVLAHFSRHRRASSLPPVTHATRGLSNEHQGAIDAKFEAQFITPRRACRSTASCRSPGCSAPSAVAPSAATSRRAGRAIEPRPASRVKAARAPRPLRSTSGKRPRRPGTKATTTPHRPRHRPPGTVLRRRARPGSGPRTYIHRRRSRALNTCARRPRRGKHVKCRRPAARSSPRGGTRASCADACAAAGARPYHSRAVPRAPRVRLPHAAAVMGPLNASHGRGGP